MHYKTSLECAAEYDRYYMQIKARKGEQILFSGWNTENVDATTCLPSKYFVGKSRPKPTKVYDTYWKFAALRQDAFFSRLEHPRTSPWSTDYVLQNYKFTNAYRAADRVSQYLIRNVIYKGDQSPEEVVFRTLLFKLFNKIDTWEALTKALGAISWSDFDWSKADKTLNSIMDRGQTVYSAAYIMPSPASAFGQKRKHSNHLKLLQKMMDDRVALRVQQCNSLQDVYRILQSYPGIGPFLAFQYAIDVNYSTVTNISENDFVVAGPGALSGIAKCFSELGAWSTQDVIRYVTDEQEREFERLGFHFRNLWGRSLHLIDCQNLFCEVDKYSRIIHPEFSGNGGRTRIKQGFKPTFNPISYWFPPKWGINDQVSNS